MGSLWINEGYKYCRKKYINCDNMICFFLVLLKLDFLRGIGGYGYFFFRWK